MRLTRGKKGRAYPTKAWERVVYVGVGLGGDGMHWCVSLQGHCDKPILCCHRCAVRRRI